jgi:hypothetical protein
MTTLRVCFLYLNTLFAVDLDLLTLDFFQETEKTLIKFYTFDKKKYRHKFIWLFGLL